MWQAMINGSAARDRTPRFKGAGLRGMRAILGIDLGREPMPEVAPQRRTEATWAALLQWRLVPEAEATTGLLEPVGVPVRGHGNPAPVALSRSKPGPHAKGRRVRKAGNLTTGHPDGIVVDGARAA
jgi:hypothetical protein